MDNIQSCRTATCQVQQEYVLGPLVFVIYINGLDVKKGGLVCKLADDTKISGVADFKEVFPLNV